MLRDHIFAVSNLTKVFWWMCLSCVGLDVCRVETSFSLFVNIFVLIPDSSLTPTGNGLGMNFGNRFQMNIPVWRIAVYQIFFGSWRLLSSPKRCNFITWKEGGRRIYLLRGAVSSCCCQLSSVHFDKRASCFCCVPCVNVISIKRNWSAMLWQNVS